MKYTQNKRIMQVEETTLVVGIDIASEGIMQEHLIGEA